MKTAVTLGLAILLFATSAYSQSLEPGKYSGLVRARNTRGQGIEYQMEIVITSVENGKLKGTIQNVRADPPCNAGVAPAEGMMEGKRVMFAALETSVVQGCEKVWFQGVLDGGNLEGGIHFNGISRKITMTK